MVELLLDALVEQVWLQTYYFLVKIYQPFTFFFPSNQKKTKNTPKSYQKAADVMIKLHEKNPNQTTDIHLRKLFLLAMGQVRLF
jgi:hypothetical protein